MKLVLRHCSKMCGLCVAQFQEYHCLVVMGDAVPFIATILQQMVVKGLGERVGVLLKMHQVAVWTKAGWLPLSQVCFMGGGVWGRERF